MVLVTAWKRNSLYFQVTDLDTKLNCHSVGSLDDLEIDIVTTYVCICSDVCLCVNVHYIIIFIIKLSFITRLNKTNLARKRVTEISKNNENKSKTRQPHRHIMKLG